MRRNDFNEVRKQSAKYPKYWPYLGIASKHNSAECILDSGKQTNVEDSTVSGDETNPKFTIREELGIKCYRATEYHHLLLSTPSHSCNFIQEVNDLISESEGMENLPNEVSQQEMHIYKKMEDSDSLAYQNELNNVMDV